MGAAEVDRPPANRSGQALDSGGNCIFIQYTTKTPKSSERHSGKAAERHFATHSLIERDVGIWHGWEALWVEMTSGFFACNDVLVEYLSGWIFTNESPELVTK